MKLYVWTNVLHVWTNVLKDWTTGIAFAYAETAERAKELIIQSGCPESVWDGILMDGQPPTVYSSECGFHLYGGS